MALAIAAPDYSPQQGRSFSDSVEQIEILRDDRYNDNEGSFSVDFETGNGIKESRSGARLEGVENNPVGQQGEYSLVYIWSYNILNFHLSKA